MPKKVYCKSGDKKKRERIIRGSCRAGAGLILAAGVTAGLSKNIVGEKSGFFSQFSSTFCLTIFFFFALNFFVCLFLHIHCLPTWAVHVHRATGRSLHRCLRDTKHTAHRQNEVVPFRSFILLWCLNKISALRRHSYVYAEPLSRTQAGPLEYVLSL